MSAYTKQAIKNSFLKLLNDRPLNQVTVKAIVEDCGINRMTFYYHFQDIFDLIDWICQEEGARAVRGRKDYRTWQEGFMALCQTVVENRTFVEGVYRSVQREQIENYLFRVVFDLLLPVIEERSQGMDISAEAQKFIADFYKYAFVGLTLEWVRTGMKDDPAALVERVSVLIHGDITKSLETCRIDK